MDDMLHRNLDALRRYLPEPLAAFLATDTKSTAALVAGEDGAINISLGDRLLYEPNAEIYCREQVDTFLENPVRRVSLIASNFLFEPDQPGPPEQDFSFSPRPLNTARLAALLPPPGERAAGDIVRDILPCADGLSLDWFPDADAGHLIAFGLGVGFHIPLLLDAIDIRHLIVVEQYPDFLKMSLRALDWRPVADRLTETGGTLSFVLGNDPEKLSSDVINLLRGPAYARLDGAYIHVHFKTDVFEKTIARIQELSSDIERSQGFFEDEMLMIRNTGANLSSGSPRAFVDRPLGRSGKSGGGTIMIVGSGPSVNAAMPEIERLRACDLPVISVGTGIGPLLAAGITPDAHCEIENIPEMVSVMEAYDGSDLSRVTLLGSTTLDPRIPPLFADLVYVFRAGLSSSVLFAKGFPATEMSGPTVANLACRAALGLGYDRLLLFGIDLGAKNPDKHHADDTLYYTQEGDWWTSGNEMAAFIIPVDGNFGGTVYTNEPFLGARSAFESLFREAPSAEVLNCSDGIRIAGAKPTVAGTIHADTANGAAEFRKLLGGLPKIDAGGADLAGVAKAFALAFQEWANRADRALAAIESRGADLDAAIDAVDALVAPGRDIRLVQSHDDLAALCVKGSLLSALQFAHTLYRRLPLERRSEFLSVFTGSLRRHVAAMARRTMEIQ